METQLISVGIQYFTRWGSGEGGSLGRLTTAFGNWLRHVISRAEDIELD